MNDTHDFFTLEHIRQSSFHTSLELTEQAIHCLELVRELAEEQLDFQFKGGNSLLVILDTPRRFSIDADIATDLSVNEIETALSRISGRFGRFIRWEKRTHKTKPWIPLSSYYLFYQSVVTGQETNVMLDVQLHRSPYPCFPKKIHCGDVYWSDTSVGVPLPSGIIGDKLLTLGPATLGIPLGKGKAAQRLKHVFDIARLLEAQPDLDQIRESFISCSTFENKLQKRELGMDHIIIDTLQCLYSIEPYPQPPEYSNTGTVLAEHVEGFTPFVTHLFSTDYSWQNLQVDMAKVAFCIAATGDNTITGQRFEDTLIDAPYSESLRETENIHGDGALQYFWNAVRSSRYWSKLASTETMR